MLCFFFVFPHQRRAEEIHETVKTVIMKVRPWAGLQSPGGQSGQPRELILVSTSKEVTMGSPNILYCTEREVKLSSLTERQSKHHKWRITRPDA